MARILIQDLPPIETLTAEELEQIFGAGRFSFRPTFEALESREMMDAGLGRSILPSLLPTAGQAAANAAQANPVTTNNMNVMYGSSLQQGPVANLAGMSVTDALQKGSNWILYEPVTKTEGAPVGKDQIRAELQMLYNKGFRGLVTYSFNNGREEIPVIAKEIGFQQVIAGLWCSGGAFQGEKTNLTAERIRAIDGFCVGNETQLRRVDNSGDRGLSLGDLKSMIQEVKSLTNKPTTTSDAWHLYQQDEHTPTELMKVGDWVFPNLHPWYETGWAEAHQNPTSGVTFVKAIMDKFFNAGMTGGKTVALHESWWSSDNPGASGSFAGSGSPDKQKQFFQELSNKGIVFVYGEAFDQSWKNEGKPEMGAFAKHWGLWQDAANAKPVEGVINYGYR